MTKHTDARIIYKPKGPALEYSERALNIYKGCTHGCLYCFGKRRMSPSQKIDCDTYANPKGHLLEKLRHKVKTLAPKTTPEILLSFIGDPYQHAEMEFGLTRASLEVLNDHQLRYTVLTKGGTRGAADFDILEEGLGRFGTSLVWLDQGKADYWEPAAASIADRIKAIQQAHEMGIPTWLSLEPVIEPDQALQVIKELHPIIKHWKVGKINHMPEIEKSHDWVKFREAARELLESLGADYYLKASLTSL